MLRFGIQIDRSPAEVFAFLRDKDTHRQPSESPVLLLEKTTDGPVRVGTRYREVVQMAPLISAEIRSEITRYEQHSVLEETWSGGGMKGILRYFFNATERGTEMIQEVEIETHWLLRPLDPLISRMYVRAARYRLLVIKAILETGRGLDERKFKWWQLSRG